LGPAKTGRVVLFNDLANGLEQAFFTAVDHIQFTDIGGELRQTVCDRGLSWPEESTLPRAFDLYTARNVRRRFRRGWPGQRRRNRRTKYAGHKVRAGIPVECLRPPGAPCRAARSYCRPAIAVTSTTKASFRVTNNDASWILLIGAPPRNASGIKLRVAPEDAVLIERNAAFAAQVRRHSGVLCNALVQRQHQRGLLQGALGRLGERIEQARHQLE